jgi:hypothetical protein
MTKLYAIGCKQLSNDLLKQVWLCHHLEALDISYCPNIDDSGMDPRGGSFRLQHRLNALREAYIRSCPSITMHPGILLLAISSPNLKCLYLDGNRQLDHMTFEVLMHCKQLRTLSICGCPNIIEATGTFMMMVDDLGPNCRIVGP